MCIRDSNSLGRARGQHIDTDKIVTFLEDVSDAPLPDGVQASLTRWSQQGTEVWLERTVLLRVADEAVMQQIEAAPEAAHYVQRLVSPTVAVVTAQDWPDLLIALAGLGLLADLAGIEDL